MPKEKKFVTKIGGSLKSLNKKWRKNIMENVVKSTAVKRKQNVRKLTALGMAGRHLSDSGGNGTFPHHPRGTVPGI